MGRYPHVVRVCVEQIFAEYAAQDRLRAKLNRLPICATDPLKFEPLGANVFWNH